MTRNKQQQPRLAIFWLLILVFGYSIFLVVPTVGASDVVPRNSDDVITATATTTATTETTEAVDDETITTSITNYTDSAFSLDQYATQLSEPYRSNYPCQPRRIHMSQKTNVHRIPQPQNESHFHNQTSELALSMTISFSLDYDKCKTVAHPKLFYRQGNHPEDLAPPSSNNNDDGGDDDDDAPWQFNFTSSINQTAFFQSDFIYHMTIPNIKAGGHRYFYRIEVHDTDSQFSEEEQVLEVNLETERRNRRRLGGGGSGIVEVRTATSTSSASLVGATPTYNFITAPFPHTPTSIALVGDLGQTKNSTKTMAHIFHDTLPTNNNPNPTSLLLIAGDMAYADADPNRWLSWFNLMEPLTRTLPMHVAAGNHEIECDNATNEIFKQYEHYFHNPNRIARADMEPITEDYRQTLWEQSCATPSEFQGHYNYGNAFYSFQHGYVHFIVLSSYSDTSVGSPQYEWLQYELQEVFDRTVTPWLVVSFHSPLYTTFLGHVNETQSVRMKATMEPLFNEHGVNLVISGHDHGYMRTHSLNVDGTVDPTGRSPIYLTLGAAGNREMHSPGFINVTAQEDWVAQRNLEDYGYANLFVSNASHAILNWVRDGVSNKGPDDKDVWIINRHFNETNSDNSSSFFYESDGTWDWPVTR